MLTREDYLGLKEKQHRAFLAGDHPSIIRVNSQDDIAMKQYYRSVCSHELAELINSRGKTVCLFCGKYFDTA